MPVWTNRVGNDSPLASISASSTDLKRIQTPHSLKRDFSADKTFYNQLVMRHCSGRVQVWDQVQEELQSKRSFKAEVQASPRGTFEPLPVICQLLPKAIPDDNRRFWQNWWLGSWSSASAQLGRVEWASTNTGRFPVGGSRAAKG